MAHLIKIYYENILGFIKSTDHLLTDHLPTDPTITDPPIRSCLKTRPYHLIYRMQTQLEKWKTILQPTIYLNRITIEWITFVFITLNISKRNGWVNCFYFLVFIYCFIPFTIKTTCKTICFSFLLAVVLRKLSEAIRNVPSELKLWMLRLNYIIIFLPFFKWHFFEF